MRDEDLDEHLNIKVKGYLRCARAFAPGMAERGWGRIVNVSGLAARQTGSVVGSVRNVAVAAMTKNLADEYGPQGVNVTVVHPGMTRTERTPDTLAAMAAARDSSPEEVEAVDRPGDHHRADGQPPRRSPSDRVPRQPAQRGHHRRRDPRRRRRAGADLLLMAEDFEQILYAVDEGVLTITLNRPERLNAWTRDDGRAS